MKTFKLILVVLLVLAGLSFSARHRKLERADKPSGQGSRSTSWRFGDGGKVGKKIGCDDSLVAVRAPSRSSSLHRLAPL